MSYTLLEQHFRELADLGHAQAMLSWDEAVMMPTGGGSARAQALATLAGVTHAKLTAPEVAELLAAAIADVDALSDWQRANLRLMQRRHQRAAMLPVDLVRAHREATARCEQAWRLARAANDFAAIAPSLEQVLKLTRERARCLADGCGTSPYDALLDEFQPGVSAADIEPVFAMLRTALPPLIERALARQVPARPLPSTVSVDAQRQLALSLMRVLGFDFEHGRLDVSHHPFSGGVPEDTRITTRYGADGVLDAQMATCHETGHALYQQGLPEAWRGQPVGDDAGMAVHESQSLLIEMQVCRSREFIAFAAPLFRDALAAGGDGSAFDAGNLLRCAHQVERGFIRVAADELTYPLHVVLRFELERALLADDLSVADLPAAWDAGMQRLLGLSTRGNDRDGCMQDVHWFAGLIGYFPSYTLGALMAAQLMARARQDVGDLMPRIGAGDLGRLRDWLRTHVHSMGARHGMHELLVAATGAPLDAAHFLRHVEERYLGNG